MSRHWPVLTGVGILCISTWIVLIMAVLGAGPFAQLPEFTAENNDSVHNSDHNAADPVQNTGNNQTSEDNSNTGSEPDSHDEDGSSDHNSMEEPGKKEENKHSGIFPGEFDYIAPEGIISIDVLLEEILKDDR